MEDIGAGDRERVRIVVPRLASLEAVVARIVPGAAELALLAAPPLPLRFVHKRRATILPIAGDDRIDGTLLAVPGPTGAVRDDVLHFLRTVMPFAAARRPQRREDVRIDLVRPAAMVPDRLQRGWLNGFTRNVSAGGILVAGAEALGAGDRLRLRFELESEDDLFDVVARVVRVDDAWGLRGLRLEQIDPRERERLVRYVFTAQRLALQRLRHGAA